MIKIPNISRTKVTLLLDEMGIDKCPDCISEEFQVFFCESIVSVRKGRNRWKVKDYGVEPMVEIYCSLCGKLITKFEESIYIMLSEEAEKFRIQRQIEENAMRSVHEENAVIKRLEKE